MKSDTVYVRQSLPRKEAAAQARALAAIGIERVSRDGTDVVTSVHEIRDEVLGKPAKKS